MLGDARLFPSWLWPWASLSIIPSLNIYHMYNGHDKRSPLLWLLPGLNQALPGTCWDSIWPWKCSSSPTCTPLFSAPAGLEAQGCTLPQHETVGSSSWCAALILLFSLPLTGYVFGRRVLVTSLMKSLWWFPIACQLKCNPFMAPNALCGAAPVFLPPVLALLVLVSQSQ